MFAYLLGVIIGGMWSAYFWQLDAIRCHLKDIKKLLVEQMKGE